MMWARFCGFLVVLVHILRLVGVSGRALPPNHGFPLNNNYPGPVQNHQPLQITRPSDKVNMGADEKGEKYTETKKIGSKPPSCSHRCYGCMPCEAIQVPTTTGHVGVLYTNYEPEGWKCKCGPTLYSP